jgi:hypothetical protein
MAEIFGGADNISLHKYGKLFFGPENANDECGFLMSVTK